MELESLDTMAALQALPETDPVALDGLDFGGAACNQTCQSACVLATVNVGQTLCLILATC
jgi:hypothetical protein